VFLGSFTGSSKRDKAQVSIACTCDCQRCGPRGLMWLVTSPRTTGFGPSPCKKDVASTIQDLRWTVTMIRLRFEDVLWVLMVLKRTWDDLKPFFFWQHAHVSCQIWVFANLGPDHVFFRNIQLMKDSESFWANYAMQEILYFTTKFLTPFWQL
jgi:hypothetical protein